MRRRPRLTWPRALLVAAIVLCGALAVLWFVPSGQYLLLPDKARPVEPLVSIDNETGRTGANGGGIYMVDILVRRANLLERIFPGLNDGATLVPGQVFNPVGVSEQQRQQSSSLDMTRSQQIAAAVALESLGYAVDATPSGAEISLVVPDSPSSGKLEPGDVIVEADGSPVKTPDDLRDAMADVKPGEEVAISYRRSRATKDVTLATRAAEDDPARAVIGVLVQQAATIDLPVKISIDAGGVGGPSAGLAFALDIVDELGQDVDQGRRIVVTGELGLDGSVEPIGGIKQKTIGAKQAGADLFIVPEENYEEAKQHGDGLEIVAVETFGEALADLGAEPVTD